MKYKIAFPTTIVFFLLACSGAIAQNVISAKAGVISYIEGTAYLDGTLLKVMKGSFFQMENGQRLKTLRGMAEVVLTPDTYLRLGENSSVQMEQNQISEIQLSMESGSALIEAIDKIKTDPILVHFQTGSVEIRHAGLYRFNSASREFCVYGGEALVVNGANNINIKGGKKIRMNSSIKPAKFSRKPKDLLHQWAARRSFDLFIDSPDAENQTNWIPTALGWLLNLNYGMHFQSLKYYVDYMRDKSNPSPYMVAPRTAYSGSHAASSGFLNANTSASAPVSDSPGK